MTLRLALLSIAMRPVRSAVLACSFGSGIAVMAALLGVGEIILDQARSPALAGGGDLVVSGAMGRLTSARFVVLGLLDSPALAGRVSALSPWSAQTLYLVSKDGNVPIHARGGIPSLERLVGDPETSGSETWTDSTTDRLWSTPDPAAVLRAMDRFHPIPDVAASADSWAEWLYFNGAAGTTRFYLTFLVGPRTASGRRSAVVRLQLERQGLRNAFSESAELEESELLAEAPDIRIGRSRVRLEGLRYRMTLNLDEETTLSKKPAGRPGGARAQEPDLTGELSLTAVPGRSLPPQTLRGAAGWISGYVVPVLSGSLGGSLAIRGEVVSLDGGMGYHDHNWGFWDGVSWQWGQASGGELSFLYGRIRPPADAADPDRIPGFLGILGPDGPLGFSAATSIVETDDPSTGDPRSIEVRGRGESLDLSLVLSVEQVVRSRVAGGPIAPWDEALDFLQMRGLYRVQGTVGDRTIDLSVRGAAESFRPQATRRFAQRPDSP